jgi:thiol:disulfide interchange protein
MTRPGCSAIVIAIVLGIGGVDGRAQGRGTTTPTTARSAEPKFDPKRDAAADIVAALAEARRSNRRVILDVGGEWCGWCHELDRYFVVHRDLKALRDKNYVWLKVNYSTENPNTAVLSPYPRIVGYPHLFVLEQDDTELLEEGPSYNYERMKGFLTKWAAK